jgi:hypothetical protein
MEERNPDVRQSDTIVKNFIPEAVKTRKVIANEVKYALPHSEVGKFPLLFEQFESAIASDSSAIQSYGVSLTTLEEVRFLAIHHFPKLEKKLTETKLWLGLSKNLNGYGPCD